MKENQTKQPISARVRKKKEVDACKDFAQFMLDIKIVETMKVFNAYMKEEGEDGK